MRFLPIIIRLIKNPTHEWEIISINKLENRYILIHYLIPLIILGCIIKITGRILSVRDFSVLNNIITASTYITINLANIYLSTWIINELLPKFKGSKNYNAVFKLITLSSFPFIIASSLASFHPNLSFIHILSIYSVILFWIGFEKLIDVKKEFQVGFILICFLMIAMVALILNFIISSLFLSIFLNF